MKVEIEVTASELALLRRMGYTEGEYYEQTEEQIVDAIHKAIKDTEALYCQYGNHYEFTVVCNEDVYLNGEVIMCKDAEYNVYTNEFDGYSVDCETGYIYISTDKLLENCEINVIKPSTLKIALEQAAHDESIKLFDDYCTKGMDSIERQ